jgi:hypothetical protein
MDAQVKKRDEAGPSTTIKVETNKAESDVDTADVLAPSFDDENYFRL